VGTQSTDLVELQTERVLHPVDGLSGAAGEDLDQVVSCQVSSRLLCVIEEDLWEMGGQQVKVAYQSVACRRDLHMWRVFQYTYLGAVWDALLSLYEGAGSVDTTGGLGRVT
jgi:hypothetical protein